MMGKHSKRVPTKPAPSIVKGVFCVGCRWRDVILGDMVHVCRSVLRVAK